jgi:hypothetical protein
MGTNGRGAAPSGAKGLWPKWGQARCTRGARDKDKGGPGPLEGAARAVFPRAGGGCSAVHAMTRDDDGAGAGAAPHVSCGVSNGIVVLP